MSDSSESYHEPYEVLAPETRDMHRAIVSLMEELEAIDWYQQRADAVGDDELREILLHNKHEEMEHAAMTLEWIRRKSPQFDHHLKSYLDTTGSIVDAERGKKGKDGEKGGKGKKGAASLGVGSLQARMKSSERNK